MPSRVKISRRLPTLTKFNKTGVSAPGGGVVPAAGDQLQLRGGLVAAVQLQHGAVPRPGHQLPAAVIPAARHTPVTGR